MHMPLLFCLKHKKQGIQRQAMVLCKLGAYILIKDVLTIPPRQPKTL